MKILKWNWQLLKNCSEWPLHHFQLLWKRKYMNKILLTLLLLSLRKQPTFCDVNTGFAAKRSLRKESRNSGGEEYSVCRLMMSHYPDLGRASDWMKQISLAAQLIRSTTLIWVVTHHQCEFLHLFISCHFAGKPVVTSQTFSCFFKRSTT